MASCALTHLPFVPHMYVSVISVNIASGNSFSPVQSQAIT